MNKMPRKPYLYNFITQSNHFIIIPSFSRYNTRSFLMVFSLKKNSSHTHTDLDMTEPSTLLCIFFIVLFFLKNLPDHLF